jgi:hypothetical protein
MYEPLREHADIDLAAHGVLGWPEAFLLTSEDVEILPRLLDAVERFEWLSAIPGRRPAQPYCDSVCSFSDIAEMT